VPLCEICFVFFSRSFLTDIVRRRPDAETLRGGVKSIPYTNPAAARSADSASRAGRIEVVRDSPKIDASSGSYNAIQRPEHNSFCVLYRRDPGCTPPLYIRPAGNDPKADAYLAVNCLLLWRRRITNVLLSPCVAHAPAGTSRNSTNFQSHASLTPRPR
jgi:hypothetical protein